MEGFLIRGWVSILSGCHWVHESQQISNQSTRGRGFDTVRGGIDPGDRHFSPC